MTTWLAWGFFTAVAAATGTGVALWTACGLGFQLAVDSFVVTDTVLSLTLASCGVAVAWRRPHNPIGWLLLGGGAAHAGTVMALGFLALGLREGWSGTTLRVLVTLALAAWPLGLRLFVPLALLLFPTGALPSPRWRPVAWGTAGIGGLFWLWSVTTPRPYALGGPPGYLHVLSWPPLEPFRPQTDLLGIFVPLLIDLAALVVRYRWGDEALRRQVLWLMLAVLCAVPWWPLGMRAEALQVLITAQPIAIAVAILCPQLLDIQWVVSRALLYLALSLGVLGVYTSVVLFLDHVLRETFHIGGAALVAVAVAIAFHPVRGALQHGIDRLLYGDRGDPVRALTRIGARLTAETGLDGLLLTVRDALRLPYAAFCLEGRPVAASGTPPPGCVRVPLPAPGTRRAELVVGTRPGQARLGAEDLRALRVLVVPLGVAVRATVLSEELQSSRERLVSAREEERRRLRRDLHDGLGPTLTGLAFTADAARNLVRSDPDTAEELLAQLRGHASGAIDEIRRLVEGLRPPALDELGLVAALARQAERLSHRVGGAPLAITVDAPDRIPRLPAAVEVAAYRIATEALTNAARHSRADHALVRLRIDSADDDADDDDADDALRIEVTDNGGPSARPWQPGVGMSTMAERAAELAGWCRCRPGPEGGEVSAVLPLRSGGTSAAPYGRGP
ncbi:sensor histidine kinase [Streptomyces longispororuber]|uniref:sensor histidine kinase n=1 Tax=Streptomyces longispororuber TaxID=68230 RepID=UPI0036FB28D3